jgi:tetratricopeptide (TPR) repeat protein
VRLGEFTSAGKAFREARRRASGDPVERARLTYKEHLIEWRLGRYPIALRWLSLGLRELDGVPGPEAGGERARLYAARAVVRGKQGRPRDSIALCRQAIEEAELSGARDALAKAYYTLDMQYSAIGRLESVENSERALAIYEDLGDLERQAIVLNSLGVYAHMQGRWDDSVDRYERARQAWDRAGDHWAASFATTNRGEVLSDQGHLDDAESLLRSALRIAKASDASTYIASISMYLGHLLARKGEFEEAHRMLEDSHDRFARAGAKGELLACDARTAECLVLEARTEEALRLGEETLATAATVEGSSELNPALERVRGCALMQLGRLEAAREALEKGLAAARELGMDYEIALCLGSLVTLEQRERRLTDDLELERDAIFQRLGVISVPAIPVH